MMDYRKLLKKYMNHIGEEEGVFFLSDHLRPRYHVDFTDEEWAELKALAGEIG